MRTHGFTPKSHSHNLYDSVQQFFQTTFLKPAQETLRLIQEENDANKVKLPKRTAVSLRHPTTTTGLCLNESIRNSLVVAQEARAASMMEKAVKLNRAAERRRILAKEVILEAKKKGKWEGKSVAHITAAYRCIVEKNVNDLGQNGKCPRKEQVVAALREPLKKYIAVLATRSETSSSQLQHTASSHHDKKAREADSDPDFSQEDDSDNNSFEESENNDEDFSDDISDLSDSDDEQNLDVEQLPKRSTISKHQQRNIF